MTAQSSIWLPLLALSLCVALSAVGQDLSSLVGPDATALAQKKLSMQLFDKDPKVKAEIKALQDSHYTLLTTEAIPYQFAYGDEGPHATFLVTAWLGKPAAHGWIAAFVTAKVNTDSFGPPSVTLLDSNELQNLLRE